MKREEYNYWISNIHNIGARKIEILMEHFGSAENVYRSTKKDLECFQKDCLENGILFKEIDIAAILNSRDDEKTIKSYAKLEKSQIRFLTKEDEGYPDKLRQIYNAPFSIYLKGKLPADHEKVLSIVGARDCSPYGKEMAKYLAGAVAAEGIAVVSGLARGIDAFAHEGALIGGGSTYAVLGCGIDICYPKENINLYMDIQSRGGILSEYAPGVMPYAGNFPMRNRIISGLCDGILVIEAKEKSGSLITVDMGLEQGKNIYALPGRATDSISEGCNNLIKMGAKLVTSPKDILEDFLPDYEQRRKQQEDRDSSRIQLGPEAEEIYQSLTREPKHIEEIACATKLQMEVLMEQLLMLELRGIIKQSMKNYYIRQ